MSLGKRLKRCADIEGLTQRDIAFATGLIEQNVSLIFCDKRVPTLKTISKIITEMPNVDARYIITGEGEPINLPCACGK